MNQSLPEHLATTTRPCRVGMAKVAVVGAGLSGLICTRILQDHGFDVTVFEKSHGPGGRMATRRVDGFAPLHLSFDHGAQYFTVRDPHFARHVETWIAQGLVAEWSARIVQIDGADIQAKTDQPTRFVGVPAMTAVARHLATDVRLHAGTRIAGLLRAGAWQLTDASGQTHRPFDRVVVSLPAPQASVLLAGHPLAAEVSVVPMTPCWAVLAAFERRVAVPWDGAFVHSSPLAWVARNSSKPGRDATECWVLHASPDWSATHLEVAPEEITALLLAEFAALPSSPLPPTLHRDAHRWRFSATPLVLDKQALFDPAGGLVVCGDWLAGGRVEGAFRSGVAAAGYLLREAGIPDGENTPATDS